MTRDFSIFPVVTLRQVDLLPQLFIILSQLPYPILLVLLGPKAETRTSHLVTAAYLLRERWARAIFEATNNNQREVGHFDI